MMNDLDQTGFVFVWKFKACIVFYCKQAPIISNIYILNVAFICILSMLSMHLPHKGGFVFPLRIMGKPWLTSVRACMRTTVLMLIQLMSVVR